MSVSCGADAACIHCLRQKKAPADPNLIDLGECVLLYKSACIMEDSAGNDAIVLTLDYTNKEKESASYLWSVNETLVQNGTELEVASIITNYDALETVIDNQFKEVAPGATLEVRTAFVLMDTTSEVKATFEDLLGSKNGTITIDPSTLSREEPWLLQTRIPCLTGGTENGMVGGR